VSRVWEEFCSRFAADLEAEVPWPDAFRGALTVTSGMPRPEIPTTPSDLANWFARATSPAWPVSLLAEAVELAPDSPQIWALTARRVVLLLDAQDQLSDDFRRETVPVRRSAWLWLGGFPALFLWGTLQGWSLFSGGMTPRGSFLIAILAGGLAVGAAVWWWLLLDEADRRTPVKSVRTIPGSPTQTQAAASSQSSVELKQHV